MTNPTDRAVRDQTLDGLLAEAAAALHPLATIEDCRRLDAELRDAIRVLADQVRAEMRHLPRGSIDWNRRDQALIGAQATLTGDLGYGLQSAARQVAALGRRARELREIAGQ